MAKDIIDFSSDDDVYLEMLEELAKNIDINEAKNEGISEGLEKGIIQGREEGISEGVSKGERAKSIDIARNMINMNIDLETISKATGLSIEEIQNIK